MPSGTPRAAPDPDLCTPRGRWLPARPLPLSGMTLGSCRLPDPARALLRHERRGRCAIWAEPRAGDGLGEPRWLLEDWGEGRPRPAVAAHIPRVPPPLPHCLRP
eukprot:12980229-Alexandrium_andersonii.AAC.1